MIRVSDSRLCEKGSLFDDDLRPRHPPLPRPLPRHLPRYAARSLGSGSRRYVGPFREHDTWSLGPPAERGDARGWS